MAALHDCTGFVQYALVPQNITESQIIMSSDDRMIREDQMGLSEFPFKIWHHSLTVTSGYLFYHIVLEMKGLHMQHIELHIFIHVVLF